MIDKFQKIELNYDVEKIYHDREQVWSFLRISYYFELYKERSEEYIANKKVKFYKKLILKFSTLFYGFSSWFGKYDYLVFSDTGMRIEIDGKYIDKSFDRLISLDQQASYLYIDLPNPKHFSQKVIPTKHIVSRNLLSIFISIFTKVLYFFGDKNFIDKELEKICQIENLCLGYQELIVKFKIQTKLMKYFLKIYKPKAIYINCYYCSIPLVKAANELNIKTIEMQHGIVGKNNAIYVPRKKFDKSYFPDTLLTFGEYDKKLIEENPYNPFNNIVAVGSNGLELIAEQPIPTQLKDLVSGYDLSVSVSTQYTVENELAEFVRSVAIENPKICFLFALRHYDKAYYQRFDMPYNVHLFHGEFSCYDILKVSDIHLTGYSMCAFEALYFEKKVFLLDIEGIATKIMGDIPSKNMHIIGSKKDLINQLQLTMYIKENFNIYSKHYTSNIKNWLMQLKEASNERIS